jgi:hypothetical protein
MDRLSLTTLGLGVLVAMGAQLCRADSAFDYKAGAVEYSKLSLPIGSDTAGYTLSADLDGDGDDDVIMTGSTYPSEGGASRGGQPGKILFNTGNNVFVQAEGDVPRSEHAREILVHDFNGDGILDLYVADHGYDVAPFPGFPDQLLLGTGTGFTDVSARLPDIAGFTHNGAAADIDGDGDIDILALNADTIAAELPYLLINDGQANFTLNRTRLPASLVDPGQLKNSYAAELADLDNDGYPDLVIGRNQYTDLTPTRIHWNDGQGNFSDDDVSYLEEIDAFGNLELLTVVDIQGVDLNSDGRRDLLVHAYNADGFAGTSIQLFINTGARQFVNETIRRLGNKAINASSDSGVPALAKVMDVNRDGHLDILLNDSKGTGDDHLFMFEGTGNGCFQAITMADVTDNAEARLRLGKVSLVSAGAFGYAEFFTTTSNGQSNLLANYVPITITPRPVLDNYLHNCSGKLKFTVLVDNGPTYAIDFSLVSMSPEILVQVDPLSIRDVVETREKPAVFSSATGMMNMQELYVDGAVFMRNLKFELVDGATLLFRLQSYD